MPLCSFDKVAHSEHAQQEERKGNPFQTPTLQFHYRLSEQNDQFEGSFALSTDHFTFSLVVCGSKNFHRILLMNVYGHDLYSWPIHMGQSQTELIHMVSSSQREREREKWGEMGRNPRFFHRM